MVTKVKLQKFWYKNKCKSIRWVSEKARIHFNSRISNTLFSLRHTLFFYFSPVLFIFSSTKHGIRAPLTHVQNGYWSHRFLCTRDVLTRTPISGKKLVESFLNSYGTNFFYASSDLGEAREEQLHNMAISGITSS